MNLPSLCFWVIETPSDGELGEFHSHDAMRIQQHLEQ